MSIVHVNTSWGSNGQTKQRKINQKKPLSIVGRHFKTVIAQKASQSFLKLIYT